MQSMATFRDVTTKVEHMARNHHDAFIPVDDLSFDNLNTIRINREPHRVEPVAQRLVCHRLGIPHYYLKKCPPELQGKNLNHWLEHERNDQLLFRFDGSAVRAVFTQRYIPLDNIQVVERLREIGYMADTQVQYSLDAQFLSLNIPDGNKTFSVNGDAITPGISIANSEVGLSSLKVEAYFLRLVCTNGLISHSSINASYRHISRSILNDLPSVISRVSMELIQNREAFRFSLESPVENPEHSMRLFNRRFQLSENEQKAVDWAWDYEHGDTMYNIIQTYTRAAQKNGLTAESSYRLQKAGGTLLSMVDHGGKEINV